MLLPHIVPEYADSATGLNSMKKHKKSRKSNSYDEDIRKNLGMLLLLKGHLSSHDCKHLAFDVMILVLPKLPAFCIPTVLSYKIVQCLMDILSTQDSWLYKFAAYFLKELSDWVSYDENRRVAVIVALQKHINGKFDTITRTKTVKALVSGFKTVGTEVTSFELHEKFRWPKGATSSALCRMCIEQLQLLLANAQKGEGPHVVTRGLEANDLGSYFMQFFNIALRNIPSVSLFRSLSNEDEKAFKQLQTMETLLSREERNCGLFANANRLHALRYLLIQLLLQILLRPGDAATELVMCCKKGFPSPDLLDCAGEDEPNGNAAPELMDTLLSLLPHSSAPMWSAIEQVCK